MVKRNNGLSISMNLVDSCTKPENTLIVYSPVSFGTVYGTYQHSTKNITLSQSKSYSFGQNGLAQVLVFNDNNTSLIFDDRDGVMLNS